MTIGLYIVRFLQFCSKFYIASILKQESSNSI